MSDMANRRSIAVHAIYCTNLVNYLLQSHSVPTTLVICSSREAFLEGLQAVIHHTHPMDHLDHSNHGNSGLVHPLLIPTIHLLATSRTVTLAFTPTLPHLRAYLATFHPSSELSASTLSYDQPGTRTPTLAILGLVALHQSTSEYSAQGMSRTLASAVEAAGQFNMRLLLAESRILQENEEMIEMGDLTRGAQDLNPWKEQVPLLSNSIKFGSETRAWAGKTIEVEKVIERWCRFVTLEEIGAT